MPTFNLTSVIMKEEISCYIGNSKIVDMFKVIKINRIDSHNPLSEIKDLIKTKNVCVLYSQVCGDCELTTRKPYIKSLERLEGIRVGSIGSCQTDITLICEKHLDDDMQGYVKITDDRDITIAYYNKKLNSLFIQQDITHTYSDYGVNLFEYIIQKALQLKTTDKKTLESMIRTERNKDIMFGITEELISNLHKPLKEINTIIEKQVGKHIADIEDKIRDKYATVLEGAINNKEEEIRRLKRDIKNTLTLDYKVISQLENKGFMFSIVDTSSMFGNEPAKECSLPLFIKEVEVTFTHSTSFGVIAKKIDPPVTMKMFIGAEVSDDFKNVLRFWAFEKLSPVKLLLGCHFNSDGICLGDAMNLLNKPLKELDTTLKKLIETLSNFSLHHGLELEKEQFPKQLVELEEEYQRHEEECDDNDDEDEDER